MKKIITKLGVLGIFLSLLISLPVVNAETCPKYMQNYLFLDVDSIGAYLTNTGYETYGAFDYTFPRTGKVNITKVDYEYVTDVTMYQSYYQLLQATQANIMNGPAYVEYNKNNYSTSNIGYIANLGGSGLYETITVLAHGKWARTNTNATMTSQWSTYSSTSDTVQRSLLDFSENGITKADLQNVTIGGGSYNRSTNTFNYSNYFNTTQNIADYIQNLVNTGADSVSFSIKRKLDPSRFTNITAGYIDNNNEFVEYTNGFLGAYQSGGNSTLKAPSNTIPSKYFKTNESGAVNSTSNPVKYYWPFVLKVEYEVCSNTSTAEWNLYYNYNDPDGTAINKPENAKASVGEKIAISSTEPTKDGYAFKGWCKDKTECTTDEIYKSGDQIESTVDVTMYAQWAKTGAEKNKDTGVISYVISFITTGLIAGGIYLVSKKKNLFKQI